VVAIGLLFCLSVAAFGAMLHGASDGSLRGAEFSWS
jgi:hypothetical protein